MSIIFHKNGTNTKIKQNFFTQEKIIQFVNKNQQVGTVWATLFEIDSICNKWKKNITKTREHCVHHRFTIVFVWSKFFCMHKFLIRRIEFHNSKFIIFFFFYLAIYFINNVGIFSLYLCIHFSIFHLYIYLFFFSLCLFSHFLFQWFFFISLNFKHFCNQLIIEFLSSKIFFWCNIINFLIL